MNESAEFELEKHIDLYKFYVDIYAKGIVIFLAIESFVLKGAIDDVKHRTIFALIGGTAALIILIPFIFGLIHERTLRRDFDRLAARTETTAVSTTPLLVMIYTVGGYWILIAAACLFVYIMPSN